jgi:hypothetical protein
MKVISYTNVIEYRATRFILHNIPNRKKIGASKKKTLFVVQQRQTFIKNDLPYPKFLVSYAPRGKLLPICKNQIMISNNLYFMVFLRFL